MRKLVAGSYRSNTWQKWFSSREWKEDNESTYLKPSLHSDNARAQPEFIFHSLAQGSQHWVAYEINGEGLEC